MRPNLHILDYCDAVQVLLDAPDEKIANEIFNVGYQNMSIMDIAQLVKRIVQEEFPEKGEIGIVTTPSDDKRSYHINSDKVRRVLGLRAQAHDRGRRARPVPRLQGRQAAQLAWRTTFITTSARMKTAAAPQ